MSTTPNLLLNKLPIGVVNWPALINDAFDKIDAAASIPASGQTTDATPLVLTSLQLDAGSVYMVTAQVVAKQADEKRASYVRRVCATRPASGGSATLETSGSSQDVFTIESDSDWDCAITAAGSGVNVEVTGKAASSITWQCQLDYVVV